MKAQNGFKLIRWFSFLLFFSATLPASSQAGPADFIGEWSNMDFATRGTTRIRIRLDGNKFMVHMWGRCHPTECDIGETTAITDPNPKSLTVIWTKNFATISQRLTLVGGGNLQLAGHTHFTDNSGRADYDSEETFGKGLVHNWSDTPTDRPRPPAPPIEQKPVTPPPAEPARIVVIGTIKDKWDAMGGGNGKLHQPLANETPTFDKIGRFQQFQGGIISWHPETGAHVVWGLIGEHWLRLGREKFGYPITDELPTSDKRGLYNHFRTLQLANKPEASIFWSKKTGAHAVVGAIRDRWARLGWDGGKLGLPTSDEHESKFANGVFRSVDFEKGRIDWSAKTGAREVVSIRLAEPVGVPIDE